MSTTYEKNKGLKEGILGNYSGKINGLVFQKNGRIRKTRYVKRKKRKS